MRSPAARPSFEGKNIFEMAPEERASAGFFLGFQYPVEIPGVSNSAFLRLAYNTVQSHRGREELDPLEFDDYVREKMKFLDMDESFLDRSVNEGFSGGEKKRNEILQMALLEPHLAILDETDSGLDIDALRVVANGINRLSNADNALVLVTHYQRMLGYIVPDYVHVMEGGRIIKTGGKALAEELEVRGYDWVKSGVEDERARATRQRATGNGWPAANRRPSLCRCATCRLRAAAGRPRVVARATRPRSGARQRAGGTDHAG
jgi:Fe-S cluster assembly ATP-binding protein